MGDAREFDLVLPGVLTPAGGFGLILIEPLQAAGMAFEVVDS